MLAAVVPFLAVAGCCAEQELVLRSPELAAKLFDLQLLGSLSIWWSAAVWWSERAVLPESRRLQLHRRYFCFCLARPKKP
ncbi:hypothetical protein J40TS1_46330 [Paenibacillus montaniterrae]|uniref:Uncharacterized protein n=1 Tax=Paenibacillus montaniterrae TaxID=429341 RepID=A0A919YUZ5_9BACL|nr:hypothetical protein J40TS1_46330 [Paenibacillus montaniterrae]